MRSRGRARVVGIALAVAASTSLGCGSDASGGDATQDAGASEVLGETDTYWKFWDDLDVNAERTYNDTLLAKASWLHGYFSGATSHKP